MVTKVQKVLSSYTISGDDPNYNDKIITIKIAGFQKIDHTKKCDVKIQKIFN